MKRTIGLIFYVLAFLTIGFIAYGAWYVYSMGFNPLMVLPSFLALPLLFACIGFMLRLPPPQQ
jgi:hypothetical protein